jgi:hypothetical protein
VKRMVEGIRKPFENAILHIVGEAYSGNQGLVGRSSYDGGEGAP